MYYAPFLLLVHSRVYDKTTRAGSQWVRPQKASFDGIEREL